MVTKQETKIKNHSGSRVYIFDGFSKLGYNIPRYLLVSSPYTPSTHSQHTALPSITRCSCLIILLPNWAVGWGQESHFIIILSSTSITVIWCRESSHFNKYVLNKNEVNSTVIGLTVKKKKKVHEHRSGRKCMECIGLAKKFIRTFPYDVTEKPKCELFGQPNIIPWSCIR